MLTGNPFPITHFRPARSQDLNPSCAISRLLAAAVINQKFRDLLLTDPDQALAQGYHGEEFPLDSSEKYLVSSIRAENLKDFALQISSHQEGKTHPGCGQWIPVNQSVLVFEAE